MWLTILGLIPGLLGIVERWQKNKLDAQVAITTAKIGGDRDKAKVLVEAHNVAEHEHSSRLATVAGNKLLTLLVIAFAAPFVIFIWKVVVWDIVFGLGATDPIKGQVSDWANTIIAFIFGTPTVLALGKMFYGRQS